MKAFCGTSRAFPLVLQARPMISQSIVLITKATIEYLIKPQKVSGLPLGTSGAHSSTAWPL